MMIAVESGDPSLVKLLIAAVSMVNDYIAALPRCALTLANDEGSFVVFNKSTFLSILVIFSSSAAIYEGWPHPTLILGEETFKKIGWICFKTCQVRQ